MTQLVEEEFPQVQNQNDISLNKPSEKSTDSFKIPQNLKKTFCFSLFLFTLGVTLIIMGFVHQINSFDPGRGLTFWILGGLVLIPGGFYVYQFCKAKRTKDAEMRTEILNEIPEIR